MALTRSELQAAIKKAFDDTVQHAGRTIIQALMWTAKNHVQRRYPGSTHWDPDKIEPGDDETLPNGASGSINVNIAGAARAYHDVTIRPVHGQALAIPIHAAAYGKKPADFNNLFTVKGKKALFINKNGALVALFALAKKAFQPQDSTLLPKDSTFAKNIDERFFKELDDRLGCELHG